MPDIEIPVTRPVAQIEPELLSKREVARLLGVSTRTIDNMIRLHRISYVKLSARMVRFPRREILQHVQQRMTVHANGAEGLTV